MNDSQMFMLIAQAWFILGVAIRNSWLFLPAIVYVFLSFALSKAGE